MTHICDTQEFMDTLAGCTIVGGRAHEDGVHFELDDGRLLILQGPVILWVGIIARETIQ